MKNSEALRRSQFCRHAKRFGLSVDDYRERRQIGLVLCLMCKVWQSASFFDRLPKDRATWTCRECAQKGEPL